MIVMSDAVLAAVITAVPGTVAAIGALIVGVMNLRKIDAVRKNTDGLVQQGRVDSQAIGRAEGAAAVVAGVVAASDKRANG